MKEFYFTFGSNQPLAPGYALVIAESEFKARMVMKENHGNKWSFMYDNLGDIHPDDRILKWRYSQEDSSITVFEGTEGKDESKARKVVDQISQLLEEYDLCGFAVIVGEGESSSVMQTAEWTGLTISEGSITLNTTEPPEGMDAKDVFVNAGVTAGIFSNELTEKARVMDTLIENMKNYVEEMKRQKNTDTRH